MDIDEGKKQYLIFSAIIALILGIIINFVFSGVLENQFFAGFPVAVYQVGGIGEFVGRVINSIVMALFLLVPVYYGIMWILNRGGGAY